MSDKPELTTIGLTPFHYCDNQPLFRVNPGVPIGNALAQASDLLCLAKLLTANAAHDTHKDGNAWAAHYLTSMSKAVVDDVYKVLRRWPPVNTDG